MEHYTDEEQRVLLALGELGPVELEQLRARTRLEPERLKAVLKKLAQRGLIKETHHPDHG